MQTLWRNRVPMCIEVLLFADCRHGQMRCITTDIAPPDASDSCILLEQWTIQNVSRKWVTSVSCYRLVMRIQWLPKVTTKNCAQNCNQKLIYYNRWFTGNCCCLDMHNERSLKHEIIGFWYYGTRLAVWLGSVARQWNVGLWPVDFTCPALDL